MTREEAIKLLTQYIDYDAETPDYYEMEKACKVAIKALEQEPCGDAISRQAVLDEIQSAYDSEPLTDEANGVDYINKEMIEDFVESLPPVTPREPKMGHWEWVQYDYDPNIGNWHCSECRNIVVKCVSKNEIGGIPIYNYCPNCGAKMESEAEDAT